MYIRERIRRDSEVMSPGNLIATCYLLFDSVHAITARNPNSIAVQKPEQGI